MSTIDHYAEAERLLGLARTTQEWVDDGHGGNHHVPEVIAAAQVHATLATVQRGMSVGTLSVDLAPADSPGYLSIPWPPSDELVERVAGALSVYWGSGRDAWKVYVEEARAMLDAIGGAGDE